MASEPRRNLRGIEAAQDIRAEAGPDFSDG
jgi:hypothetical protein